MEFGSAGPKKRGEKGRMETGRPSLWEPRKGKVKVWLPSAGSFSGIRRREEASPATEKRKKGLRQGADWAAMPSLRERSALGGASGLGKRRRAIQGGRRGNGKGNREEMGVL